VCREEVLIGKAERNVQRVDLEEEPQSAPDLVDRVAAADDLGRKVREFYLRPAITSYRRPYPRRRLMAKVGRRTGSLVPRQHLHHPRRGEHLNPARRSMGRAFKLGHPSTFLTGLAGEQLSYNRAFIRT
jgi:hypothetical protein